MKNEIYGNRGAEKSLVRGHFDFNGRISSRIKNGTRMNLLYESDSVSNHLNHERNLFN